MNQILKIVPENRQTALFSATQTKKVGDLARLSFPSEPIYVDVDEGRKKVTNEGLQQGYIVVPSERRSILLYSFLKRNLSKKIMVFFSSCNSVKFHSELLRYIDLTSGMTRGITLGSRATIFMESKNNSTGQALSSSSAKKRRVYCYALMWQLVGLIFLL